MIDHPMPLHMSCFVVSVLTLMRIDTDYITAGSRSLNLFALMVINFSFNPTLDNAPQKCRILSDCHPPSISLLKSYFSLILLSRVYSYLPSTFQPNTSHHYCSTVYHPSPRCYSRAPRWTRRSSPPSPLKKTHQGLFLITSILTVAGRR